MFKKIIPIAFNPLTITSDSECYSVFKAGNIPLAFWALYKSTHITSDRFKLFLDRFVAYFDDLKDPNSETVPYNSLCEFIELLRQLRFTSTDHSWLVEHWDHFNINIQREVILEYKDPVHGAIRISSKAPTVAEKQTIVTSRDVLLDMLKNGLITPQALEVLLNN